MCNMPESKDGVPKTQWIFTTSKKIPEWKWEKIVMSFVVRNEIPIVIVLRECRQTKDIITKIDLMDKRDH